MQPTLTFTGLDRRPIRLRPSAIADLGSDEHRHAVLHLTDGRIITVQESGQIVRLALRQVSIAALPAAFGAISAGKNTRPATTERPPRPLC